LKSLHFLVDTRCRQEMCLRGKAGEFEAAPLFFMFMVAGWMRGTVGENDGSDKINCCIPGKILLQRPTITRSPRVRSPIPDRVARYLPFTTGAFGVEWVSSPAIFIHGATVGPL
jgi:hypothetical protein